MRSLLVAVLLLPAIARAIPLPVGPEFQVNTYTTGTQFDAAVAADPSGRFVVVWSTYRGGGDVDVVAQRYDAAGAPNGGEFQVNTYTTDRQELPAVASDPLGNFVVAWTSYADEGGDPVGSIRARRFDAAGIPLGDQFAVNTYTTSRQSEPRVAMQDDGSFVVTWVSIGSPEPDSADSIHARYYDASGIPVGDEFQVNTYTTGTQASADVAIDSLGRVLFVWHSAGSPGSDTSGNSVQGRRFDRSGAPLGPQFQVNSYTTSYQSTPAAKFDGLGNFVVTWVGPGEGGTDTNGFAVHARRFDAGATPLGDPFQVNTYTTNNQLRPRVATTSAGTFVITWLSGKSGEGYSEFVLRGQLHDATGARVGEEFAVSTYTSIHERPPGVATTPDGFVVVWSASGSTGTDTSFGSVQARRFVETTTTTTVSAASTTTSTSVAAHAVAGTKLLLTDRGESKRRLAVRIADSSPATVDPTIAGALLQVHAAGGGTDNLCLGLHAGAWRAKGRGPRRKFVYDDCAGGGGLCVRARLRPGKRFAAKARGPLGYSLDEPQQGAVGVRFDGGGAAMCALFGGRVKKDSGGPKGRFQASAAPAGTACAVSPPCP